MPDPSEIEWSTPPDGNEGDVFDYELRPNGDWDRRLNKHVIESDRWPDHPVAGNIKDRSCAYSGGSWNETYIDYY